MNQQTETDSPALNESGGVLSRALAVEAHNLLAECGDLLNQFDAIAEALHDAGFTAFPITDAVTGWDEGGMLNLYSLHGSEFFRGCSLEELLSYLRPTETDDAAHLPREPQRSPTTHRVSAVRTQSENRTKIGENFNWTCVYCHTPGSVDVGPDGRTWHLDHLYAESRGGDRGGDNMVLACATCNLKKSATLLADFLSKSRPAHA